MLDGELTVPYGEVSLEERQRHQQEQIQRNRSERARLEGEFGTVDARRSVLGGSSILIAHNEVNDRSEEILA